MDEQARIQRLRELVDQTELFAEDVAALLAAHAADAAIKGMRTAREASERRREEL